MFLNAQKKGEQCHAPRQKVQKQVGKLDKRLVQLGEARGHGGSEEKRHGTTEVFAL